MASVNLGILLGSVIGILLGFLYMLLMIDRIKKKNKDGEDE